VDASHKVLTHLPTHSLTYPPTYSLAYSLAYSLTHSLTYSLTYSLFLKANHGSTASHCCNSNCTSAVVARRTNPLNPDHRKLGIMLTTNRHVYYGEELTMDYYSVTTYSLTYLLLLTHSLPHSLTYSLTHSLTHSLTDLLTHSPTYLLTHSLTHLLTHSLTYSLTY
jgi:hypothetical protein